MLYRQALIDLGGAAQWYVSELSHRRRGQLREEILGVYALYAEYGAADVLVAMAVATERGVYGAEYLRVLLAFRREQPDGSLPPLPPLPSLTPAPSTAPPVAPRSGAAGLPRMEDVAAPRQEEIDRQLSLYEAFVWTGSSGETPGAPGKEPGATARTTAAAEVVR